MSTEVLLNPLSYSGLFTELALLGGIFLICLLVFMVPDRADGASFWLSIVSLGLGFFWSDAGSLPKMPWGLVAEPWMFILKRYFCLSAAAFVFVWLEWQQGAVKKNSPLFFVMVLLSCLSLLVLVQANSLWMMLLAAEGFSFSAYALALSPELQGKSGVNILRYFGIGAFATGISVFGLTWILGFDGVSMKGLDEFKDSLAFFPLAGAVFFLGFLLFKTGCFPFHAWMPGVFRDAPVPVAGYLASAPKVAAAFAILRLIQMLNLNLSMPMLILCILTGMIGNLAALRTIDVKQMLAYSSVGMAAFLLIPSIFVRQVSGSEGQLLYFSLAYGTAMQAVFCACQYFQNLKSDRLLISDFAGIFQLYPAASIGLSILIFSIIGIPPLAGFTGKLLVLSSLPPASGFSLSNWTIILFFIGVLITVVSAGYFFRLLYQVFFGKAQAEISLHRSSMVSFLLMWMGIGWQLFAFLYPEFLLQAIT